MASQSSLCKENSSSWLGYHGKASASPWTASLKNQTQPPKPQVNNSSTDVTQQLLTAPGSVKQKGSCPGGFTLPLGAWAFHCRLQWQAAEAAERSILLQSDSILVPVSLAPGPWQEKLRVHGTERIQERAELPPRDAVCRSFIRARQGSAARESGWWIASTHREKKNPARKERFDINILQRSRACFWQQWLLSAASSIPGMVLGSPTLSASSPNWPGLPGLLWFFS